MADWKTKPSQENETKYRDYAIDNTPLDFANYTEQSDPDLHTIYKETRKRELYIYPLNNLIKNTNKPNLYFSPNVVKIGFIDPLEVKKTIAYEVSDFNLELDARNATNIQDNSVEYTMVDAKTIIFQDESLYGKFNIHVVSIGEPANENNLDELYIINFYTERYAPKSIKVTKETVLVRVQDFKVRGSNPIIVRIQKQLPEDTKVKAITIKFPRQALFGNIKLIGKVNGVEGYPRLFIENDKVMLPMLSMPIETEPKVRILQQWMSSQVLAWEKAKLFFNEKSALDLIKIDGGGTETRKKVYTDARVSQLIIKKAKTRSGWQNPPEPPEWPTGDDIEVNDSSYTAVADWVDRTDWFNRMWVTTTNNYGVVQLEFKYLPKIDSLQRILLDMLNYTYNYRTNFKYAEYYTEKDDKPYVGEPKNAVAKLRVEKFVGQKPEVVITNIFEDWKFENPKLVNHPSVKIFKQIVMMLSEYIFSDLSINTGLNDDYKVLLPYYFELISEPILEDGEYKFKDVEVKLKSEYFNFGVGNIKLKNKDISQNKLLKLNDNQFNWLPLVNNLQANDIPSLLPKDIKLSDGNYGKNFVNCIVEEQKLNKIMSVYGNGLEELLSNFEWVKEINKFNATNKCRFILENEVEKFKCLEISAIFGNGQYDFEIETTYELINIQQVNLFNEKSSSYSLIEI
ncbi:hypothetical protein [Spiroplasma endosymbiont of Asaphidion curtum]|uniref:hypothetical protein n=1 Tax=Spiroplasma endosymbiont of Asaphidion curtum TaxID=3066281 RepID=UPI00313D588D